MLSAGTTAPSSVPPGRPAVIRKAQAGHEIAARKAQVGKPTRNRRPRARRACGPSRADPAPSGREGDAPERWSQTDCANGFANSLARATTQTPASPWQSHDFYGGDWASRSRVSRAATWAASRPRQLRSNQWIGSEFSGASEGQDSVAVDTDVWCSWVTGFLAWRVCSDSSSESSSGFSTACLP